MNDLIIARYNESLDWILEVPAEFSIRIFNKGEAIASPSVLERATSIEQRPNIGRESETYLQFLLRKLVRGEAWGEFTVFTQGDPFEHSPDFLELLKNWHSWSPVQPLGWCWQIAKNVPPQEILTSDANSFLGSARLRPELFSLALWNPLRFLDTGAYQVNVNYRRFHQLPVGTNIASHFLGLCGLQELQEQAARHEVGKFSYGAIFAAHRSRMSWATHEVLRKMLFLTSGPPVYGYIFERMWLHLFGEEFLLPSL